MSGAPSPGSVMGDMADDSSDTPEPEPSGGQSLTDRLMATEGGQPLPEIEGEYGLDKPTALIVRASQKMASSSGMPAIAEFSIGGFLLLRQLVEDYDGDDSADDGTGISVE